MTALVYRAEDGSLAVGKDSVEAEVVNAVYRSTAGKEIVVEDNVFVEKSLDGKSSRVLFVAS